jgi:uncharacterized protein YecT (DUF1311 family)
MQTGSRIRGGMAAAFVVSLTIGLLYPAVSAPRQEREKKHPIDAAMDACVDKNPSTQGTVHCIMAALKSWDGELNSSYQKLSARLDGKGKMSLKAAQLQWIKYRDAELVAIRGVYAKTDGTMYRPMAAEDAMQVTRQRVLQLNGYLDTLKIDQP